MEERKYIVFNPEVQRLVESYSYCFNVKVTFYSLDLEELLVGPHSAVDDYCSLIQKKLHIRYRCLKQDHMICQQCRKQKQRVVYTCHAGLTEAVIPIHISGSLVCYALIGQFRTTNVIPSSIMQLCQEKNLEGSVLEDAFMKRPIYDNTMLQNMFELFRTTLSLLIETQAMKLRQPDLIERILAYIDANIGHPIAMDDVARFVNMSRSSITHTLQQQIKLSFQQLLINKRLANFEYLILNDPSLQIQQAALLSGYHDPLYFSRLYKKNRGQTPSEFLHHTQFSANDQRERYLSKPLGQLVVHIQEANN